MAHKNSMLSRNLDFYSAYEHKEQEETSSQNIFMKILLKLLLIVTLFTSIYFAVKYSSNIKTNFKKFDFWNIEKQSEPSTPNVNIEVTHTKKNLKEKEVTSKKARIDRIVKKVMDKMSKEKEFEVLKTSVTPSIKSAKAKEDSQGQEENNYLVDDYLDVIKKELNK